MSTYDNQLPRIPLEVLERVARMTDNITAALNTSGVLSACADLQRLTAQSLVSSFEVSQRLSAALQPLLDYMTKLSEELPTPADTLQSLADKIDDSVLDEASAAIEEALPYMEPEAREYCIAEALPKLMPAKRAGLSRSDVIGVIGGLVSIFFGCVSHLDNVRQSQPEQPAPTIVYQINVSECPVCGSADCVQNVDDDIRIIDDGLQAVDGTREDPDPVEQGAAVDGQNDGVN